MAQNSDLESDLEYINIAIIREIYDGENAIEAFENDLERALEIDCANIIIEPARLGEDTARWIAVGNCLNKTAILSGFGAIVSSFVWPKKHFVSVPFATLSLFCSGLYTVSWKTDPCCKYQVETDPKQLDKLPLETLASSAPVVLVRKDDSYRFILQTSVTLVSVAVCAYRLYHALRHT